MSFKAVKPKLHKRVYHYGLYYKERLLATFKTMKLAKKYGTSWTDNEYKFSPDYDPCWYGSSRQADNRYGMTIRAVEFHSK